MDVGSVWFGYVSLRIISFCFNTGIITSKIFFAMILFPNFPTCIRSKYNGTSWLSNIEVKSWAWLHFDIFCETCSFIFKWFSSMNAFLGCKKYELISWSVKTLLLKFKTGCSMIIISISFCFPMVQISLNILDKNSVWLSISWSPHFPAGISQCV